MRIEQHLSRVKHQWHVHLYMSKDEFEKQELRHITTVNGLDCIVGLDKQIKIRLKKLFESGLTYVEIKREYADFDSVKQEYKDILENSIYEDDYEDYHIETIKCPNCNVVQKAKVLHKTPFYDYTHECEKCKYIIMESEWEQV